MTNPRFGFDNLLHSYKDGVICVNEDADALCFNSYDWRPQTYWRQQRSPNEVGNGDFLLFTAGPSSEPDGWTLTGAGASVAKLASATAPVAPNVVQVTRSGADAFLSQDLAPTSPEDFVGKSIGIAAYLSTSTASQARITIDDGVGTTSSSFHTGGGTFERLQVSRTIVAGATQLVVSVDVLTTDGTVDADAFMAAELTFGATTLPEYDEVAEAAVYVFPADGQLLRNWTIDSWTSGGEALPDLYEAALGTPTQITRSQDSKVGRYALDIDGNATIVSQEISGDELESVRGQRIRAGVWCKTSTAARAKVAFCIRYRDGTLSTEVAGDGGAARIHTGGGAYEWLTTGVDVPHDVTGVGICLVNAGGAGDFVATWDGPILAEGVGTAAETPHPQDVDYLAVTSHNLGTADRELRLEGSDDNFATSTPVLSTAPSDDLSKWVDLEPIAAGGPGPSSFDAYKIFSPELVSINEQPIEIGVMAFGKFFEMPCAPLAPFNVLNEKFGSELPKTRGGAPLGRSIPRLTKAFDMRFQILDRTFITDELYLEWWKHAGGTKGLPFFLEWNDGDYNDETYLVWLKDNEEFNPSLFPGQQVRSFRIRLEGLPG